MQARSQQGEWLLRIEDIDPPREQPEAANDIRRCLEAYGLYWDGPVLYQSSRHEAYRAVLQQLQEQQLAYACTCSRKHIRETAQQFGAEGPIYPGHCRNSMASIDETDIELAWRLNCANQTATFHDELQGSITENIDSSYGDFILWRRDGLPSYQLAVVIDDAMQGITQIVRGMDLFSTTSRQALLQRYCGYPTPNYLHIPLVVGSQGDKLSKQTHAAAIPTESINDTLFTALSLLGIQLDVDYKDLSPSDLLTAAVPLWRPQQLQANKVIPAANWQQT